MTLIKSLLLGSAAGIVAVASAQAADLPTKKGAPAAQYVKICTITAGGTPITGFVLPGSDTCLKISGYITGQIEGGNLSSGGRFVGAGGVGFTNNAAIGAASTTFGRSSFGFTTRGNLTLDAVSNTAAGPLLGHVEYQFNNGTGFDNTGVGGSDGGLNRAYIQWAGITAGKANSFFSFTGGGPAWANFFSPDRQGFQQPDLLAYTASFGGGFSATLSIESPYYPTLTSSSPTVLVNSVNALGNWAGNTAGTVGGIRAPDVVANIRVDQSWGSAQLSGALHNVRGGDALGLVTVDTWGWAIDGGVKFNLPSIGGDVLLTGAYSKKATMYSGLGDGMWGESGAVNGNGVGMLLSDIAYNGTAATGFASPTAWSLAATADFKLNPQISISPEVSYGQVSWSGVSAANLANVYNSKSFIVGAVGHYDPVPGLDFELELLYQNTQNSAIINTPLSVSGSNGFAARFEVTRSF